MRRDTWTYGADLVFTACHANDWGVADLARVTGYSESYLNNVLNGYAALNNAARRTIERQIPRERKP